MNKTDLIKVVANKASISLKDATAAVEAYHEAIAEALKAGDKVAITNFGTYQIKDKPESQGFNPSTKQVCTVKARKSPVLKFGKAFKDLFN